MNELNMSSEKILFVDDDPDILKGFARQLHKDFRVRTALGAAEGLDAFKRDGPFAVVVSDMRMPGTDGIQFLTQVKHIAPDTVRMMLTGFAEFKVAADAVNEGNIFRFLTKPCPYDALTTALKAGLEQYRLINAEKELLNKTLKGSIRVLTEILSAIDPECFGQSVRVREMARSLAREMNIDQTWDLELGAMLSRIGSIAIPEDIRKKIHEGEALMEPETEMLVRIPDIGRKLLSHIPRLEQVADIVYFQNKHFDGSGYPVDGICGEQIPFGARMMKIINDFLDESAFGAERDEVMHLLDSRDGWYDPVIMEVFRSVYSGHGASSPVRSTEALGVRWEELREGDILLSSMETHAGKLLLAAGQKITQTLLLMLANHRKIVGIREPIRIERKLLDQENQSEDET